MDVENLSDVDLLSIILRTGTKDANVKEVSSSILASVGSITNMADVGIRELSKIKGKSFIEDVSDITGIVSPSLETSINIVPRNIEIKTGRSIK